MAYGYPDRCPSCASPLMTDGVDVGVGLIVDPSTICCSRCEWTEADEGESLAMTERPFCPLPLESQL